jgi:hypothetical protein
MSTPNKYAPATNGQPPRCPYCSAELSEVNTYQWVKQLAIGIGMTLAIYCPDVSCRKLLGTQIMIVPHAEEQGSIVKPS